MEVRAAQAGDVSAVGAMDPVRLGTTSRVFVSTNESNTPMRTLLSSEGWTPSGVLTGLDEGDPEQVFFYDVPPAPAPEPA